MTDKRKFDEEYKVSFLFPDGKSAIVTIHDKKHNEEFEHWMCPSGKIVKIPDGFASYRSRHKYFWNDQNLSKHLEMLPERYLTELSEGLNSSLDHCATKGYFVWNLFESFKLVLSVMFDENVIPLIEDFDMNEICGIYKSILHYGDVGHKCEKALNAIVNMKKISESKLATRQIMEILKSFEPKSENERKIVDTQLANFIKFEVDKGIIKTNVKFVFKNTLQPESDEVANILSDLDVHIGDYMDEKEKEWSRIWEEKEWMIKVLPKK